MGWNLTNGVGPAGGADQALLNYIHVDLVAHHGGMYVFKENRSIGNPSPYPAQAFNFGISIHE